jgi:hypothetical protein
MAHSEPLESCCDNADVTTAERSDCGASRWHQALAYSLLGRIEPRLGVQDQPDLRKLLDDLDELYADGRAGLCAEIQRARETSRDWPHAVPANLRAGLGPAQFAAALAELRRLLHLDAGPRQALADRPPDAVERALLREVPPHHGS